MLPQLNVPDFLTSLHLGSPYSLGGVDGELAGVGAGEGKGGGEL